MDEQLVILLKHLPALRAEGVTRLQLDGIDVLLGPLPLKDEPKVEEEPKGRDPVMFGLPPGTKMPTLKSRR